MKFTTRLYCTNPVAYEAYITARIIYKNFPNETAWDSGRLSLARQVLSSMLSSYKFQLRDKIRMLTKIKQQKALDVSGNVVVLG